MKTLPRITVSLLPLLAFLSLPPRAPASQARLEASGGLGTVLADETSDLNLFVEGNPAGLALLHCRSRLDLSGRVRRVVQQGPWGSSSQQDLSLMAQDRNYGGLILFTDQGWAFQAAAGADLLEGPPLPSAGLPGTKVQDLSGTFRTAYSLPFGAAALEVRTLRSDLLEGPVPSFSPALLSGRGSYGPILLKPGLAAVWDEGGERWQLGCFLSLPVGPSDLVLTRDMDGGAGTVLSSRWTSSILHAHEEGLEWILEFPSSFKASLRTSFKEESSSLEGSGGWAFPRAKAYGSGQWDLQGDLQGLLAAGADENIRFGGSLGFSKAGAELFPGPWGAAGTWDRQVLSLVLGIGLEEVKDYTVGIQWKSRTQWGLLPSRPGSWEGGDPGEDRYQLAVGGERWLSASWALRMGLVLEEIEPLGGLPQTFGTSLRAGIGWEGVLGRMDLGLSMGDRRDRGNQDNGLGELGAELSGTFFL